LLKNLLLNSLLLKSQAIPKHQRGQATLEYAIILILVVTMIIGGIELASTAFASSKASEAAKAGANEFAEANVLIKKSRDLQQGFIRELHVQFGITTIADDAYSANTAGTGSYDNYIEYLNDFIDTDDYVVVLNAIKDTNSGWDTVDSGTDISDDEVRAAPASADKYKALALIEQIKLVDVLPVIADHNPALLANPSCGAGNTYDDGLPDRYLSGNGTDDQIYLFNPLPIDLASCAGVDATRDNKSKISILVGGYGTIDDPATYVQGLPKLNQAMYGQYTKVCLNAANEYVSCNKAHAQMLLKPPGKLCLSNTASNTVDSCTADTPPIGSTGYYFWGQVNDSAAGDFAYSNTEAIEFRPTFQIACNGNSALDPNVMDDDCLDTANLKTVQVHTRYRAVFESFLTFGLQELADADLAQYFFDPSNLRGLGANLGVGIAGSELGPKHQNKNVTVKQFKDFRGCYEVDVETNQVSACS
jgi:Flp pilus assembly protein TadG